MYYVYVLKSPTQFYTPLDGGVAYLMGYTGSTTDLRRRLAEHKANKVLSTKNRGEWSLVYYEACRSEKDARLREKYLKTAWGKRYIRNRIKHDE